MDSKRKELVISSDTENLDVVEAFVRDLFCLQNICDEVLSRVLVCLNEAVLNSISHGNRFEKEKKVIIQSYCCKKYIYFRIIDEGIGFDFTHIPDPTNSENLFKEDGRGIYIIRKVSDGILYRDKGNIVEFRIKTGKDD